MEMSRQWTYYSGQLLVLLDLCKVLDAMRRCLSYCLLWVAENCRIYGNIVDLRMLCTLIKDVDTNA